MRYSNILFDFDGTLFDTSPGILRCIAHALTEGGYAVGTEREMKRFIGPPVLEALQEFYGMDEREAERVKTIYRTAYRAEGVYECTPIPGAEACLRALKDAGARLAIATSKPICFAREILRRFCFENYFAAVCGAESDAHSGKAEIVRRAMAELGADPADCVMVGDRKYDILGAKACGIPCIVLDSGFAEPGEYEAAGALRVFADYPALQAFLLESRA